MTMDAPLSTRERRRRAPLAFRAKADNARFVAYLLWQEARKPPLSWPWNRPHADPSETLSEAASKSGYYGTPSIAAHEGFLRESALALELIVKTVIAQKIELGCAPSGVVRVRPVHDLPRLWTDAGLPSLSREDQRRLLLVKWLLNWSGRYAAPKTDDQFYQEEAADDALRPPGLLKRNVSWDWEDFDRLYQLAFSGLGERSPPLAAPP
jgi:hypothetical protein